MRKLSDTDLPDHFSRRLFTERGLDLGAEHLYKVYDSAVTGIANLLKHSKSMERPTAYIIKRFDNLFVVGCVVQYFPNTDDDNPGNWSMVWTFNEADIPENALKIEISNPDTHSYIVAVAGEKYGMRYPDDAAFLGTNIVAFQELKQWLDENAKEGEEVGIEVEGLFQARVAVENGEKVFAMEADGEIKNIIKDDAAIEK
ncbi:MAG: hypothetical protein IKR19_07485 [Acholeplasmatales bacterium]|nr:hypothetical protein [Acholeplasmatales bacterium]